MTDNYTFTPGTGATGAADNVGGVLYPRAKVGFGADGAYGDVTTGNPLPVAPTQSQITTTTVTIALNGNLSGSVDLGTARLGMILMPAAWDAATLTFQASVDNSVWKNMYDRFGTEVNYQAGIDRIIPVDVSDFMFVRYLKVRSGTLSAPVTQLAARTITLILQP